MRPAGRGGTETRCGKPVSTCGRISQIGRCCDFRDRSELESLTKAQLHGNLPRAWSTNVGGRQIVKHSTKG